MKYIAILTITLACSCLAIQNESPAPLYSGAGSLKDKATTGVPARSVKYNCSVQVKLPEPYIMAPLTLTQVTETVEEKLSERGILCSDIEHPRLTIDLTVSNEYGPGAAVSAYLSAFSLALIPGYLGNLRHSMGVSVEVPGGKISEHRFSYATSHAQFSWFLFIVGGLPGGYVQNKNAQAIGTLLDTLIQDMDRARDVPEAERLTKLVLLKNGQRYYNARTTEREESVQLTLPGGTILALPKSQIDSIKPMPAFSRAR